MLSSDNTFVPGCCSRSREFKKQRSLPEVVSVHGVCVCNQQAPLLRPTFETPRRLYFKASPRSQAVKKFIEHLVQVMLLVNESVPSRWRSQPARKAGQTKAEVPSEGRGGGG